MRKYKLLILVFVFLISLFSLSAVNAVIDINKKPLTTLEIGIVISFIILMIIFFVLIIFLLSLIKG